MAASAATNIYDPQSLVPPYFLLEKIAFAGSPLDKTFLVIFTRVIVKQGLVPLFHRPLYLSFLEAQHLALAVGAVGAGRAMHGP
jgi:hypothetical protein